jgi:hypothetical protein
LALRHNPESVHGLDKLTDRIPHVQADPRSETSKRRKESRNSPANSCQCFSVVNAPEIYQSAGQVVVSKFLTAIQASDVGSSAIDRPASGKVGWAGLAQCYGRTLVLMKTDKNKTKERAQKERHA